VIRYYPMNRLPLLLVGILLGACGVLRGQSFDLTTGRVQVVPFLATALTAESLILNVRLSM